MGAPPPQWGMFSYIKGSSLRVTDLNRAGAKRAQSVICLAGTEETFSSSRGDGTKVEVMDHENAGDAILGDHNAVFTAHILGTYFPSVPFAVHLYHTESIRLVDVAVSQDGRKIKRSRTTAADGVVQRYQYSGASGQGSRSGADDFVMDPSYASGRAFVPVVFEALLVQSFYNPYIATLLRLLVSPAERSRTSSFYGVDSSNAPSKRTAPALRSVTVPEALHGALMGDVFSSMLESGLIVLALYRSGKVYNTALPFVFTCPSPATIVDADDKLIVLSE